MEDIAKVIAAVCEASSSSTVLQYMLNMGLTEERKRTSVFEDVLNFRRFAKISRKRSKSQGYSMSPIYYSDDFTDHFRMQRQTVEWLMKEIGPSLQKPTNVGRPRCDIQTTVLHTIWTLSNQESFRAICDRFNIGIGNGHRMFLHVCKVLVEKRHLFIKWPSSNHIDNVVRKFEMLHTPPFPNVIGCIDASYIKIKSRKAEAETYCTPKKFQAVILQGVCDADCRFIHVFAGWPGSADPAEVWKNNDLYKRLCINPDALIPQGYHLVGDSTYPLDTFLMVPYESTSQLTLQQKRFNKSLKSITAVVQHAFAMLKSRFQRLKFLDMMKIDQIPVVIVAACILHNVCIDQKDILEQAEEDLFPIESDKCTSGVAAVTAVTKRNNICNTFFS